MAQGIEYRVEEKGFDMKSVFPDAANTDLYDNGKQTFNIGSKGDSPLAIYNFKFVEPENFGGGKLIGAEVDLYLNSINKGWNGTDINGIKVFKDNQLIDTEGGSSGITCVGKEGADIYTLTSYVNTNSTCNYLYETFEQTVYGTVTNSALISSTTMGSDPYLPLRVAWNNGRRFGNKQSKESKKKSLHAYGAGIGVDRGSYGASLTPSRIESEEKTLGRVSADAITPSDVIVPLIGAPNHAADSSGINYSYEMLAGSLTVGALHIPGSTVWSMYEMPTLGLNTEDKYHWADVKRHVKWAGTYTAFPEEMHEYQGDKPMSTTNTFWDSINTHSNMYGREPVTTTMGKSYGIALNPEHHGDIKIQTRANIFPWKFGGNTSPTSMCMEAYYCAPHITQTSAGTYGSMLFDGKNPLSQEINAIKSNIPAPIAMQSREKSGLGSSTPADTALATPVVAPTIEIQINISRLPEVFKQEGWADDTSDSMDNQSDMEIRLNRFFAVCLSERAPTSGESFYDFYKDMADNTKNCFGTFFYQRDGKTMITDFAELAVASGGSKFDTRHKELCLKDTLPASTSLKPTVEDAVDLKGKWFILQYECSPTRNTATHNGKLVRSIIDPNTSELLYPVRRVASLSGETDLQANWPTHFSVWVVNTPPCGGRTTADLEYAEDYFDSSFVLDMEMAADDDDSEEIGVGIKKRVRNDAYSYENVDAQGVSDAFHFRVGEKVRIGQENMTVMERYITSDALTSGNATGTANASYLVLKRHFPTSGSTKTVHYVNSRLYRRKNTSSDMMMQNEEGSKIKLYIDSIKFSGFNNTHINSTNNTLHAFNEDIQILPEADLIARRPLAITQQAALSDSTEWTQGSLINNPCYAVGNQYLSFGFQTLTNLTDDDEYLFFSGFDYGAATNTESINSTPWSTASRMSSLRAGYSDGSVTNGGQYKNEVFMNKSSARAVDMRGLIFNNSDETSMGGGLSYPNIIHGRDGNAASAVDAPNNLNFTEMWNQPGILKIADNLWDTSISDLAKYLPIKRENIYASARVLKIIDEKTIEVDSNIPLLGKDDEDYIIYKYGAAYGTGTVRTTARPAASSDPEASGNSLRASSIAGNVITFPVPILLADDNATALLTDANLPLLMISPRRAWLIFEFNDGTEEARNRIRTPAKSYESVVQIIKDGSGNLPVAGPTFSETQFTDGIIPFAPINRDIFDPVLSSLELKTDYGYGAMNDSDGSMDTVGHLGIMKLHSGDTGKYNTLDISGLVTVDSLIENDEVGLFYTPASTLQSGLVNFDTEDGTNPPKHWSIFFDELPEITKFSVNPDKSNSFSPFYEWEINADDAWYGILIASDKMIASQYHNSVAHIPLDEDVTTYGGVYSNTSTAATAGTFTNYKGGLAGKSKRFNGSADYIKFGHAAISTKPTTKMSVVAHIVPNNTPAGDEYIIFKDDGSGSSVSARTEFSIYINSSGQIGAKVVSGSNTHALLSHSIITTDGYTPTSIILTVDAGIKSENVKLFLNGQLEDNTGGRKTTGTTNNWQTGTSIGASGVSNNDLYIGAATTNGSARANFFDGNIEEIVIYNDVIYPVSPELGYFTLQKPFKEQNNGSIRPITARLFIKDHHNIRGSSTSQVAASSMVSFSKPSFNLYG